MGTKIEKSKVDYCVQIGNLVDKPKTLHVELSSASSITFDLVYDDYDQAIYEVCRVAPAMMNLDADLQEAYDDAFRTQPKANDIYMVKKFLNRYKGKITPDIMEMFDFS